MVLKATIIHQGKSLYIETIKQRMQGTGTRNWERILYFLSQVFSLCGKVRQGQGCARESKVLGKEDTIEIDS